MGGCGLDLSGLGWGQVVGCCEHGCEVAGKFREFFDQLRNCQLFKKNSTPWIWLFTQLAGCLVGWLGVWLVNQSVCLQPVNMLMLLLVLSPLLKSNKMTLWHSAFLKQAILICLIKKFHVLTLKVHLCDHKHPPLDFIMNQFSLYSYKLFT